MDFCPRKQSVCARSSAYVKHLLSLPIVSPEGGHSAYTLYAIYTHCPSPRAFILLSFDVPRTSGDTHKCHQKNIKAPPLSPISLPSSTERIMSPCASSARRHGLSPIAYYAVRMPRSRCAPSSTNHPAATQLFPGD